MNKNLFLVLCFFLSVNSACAESFLTAQKFPKIFDDLSFSSRLEVLRDGYMPFEVEYDANGVCVRGCAYRGITIKEDMMAVDEANEEMEKLIVEAESEQKPISTKDSKTESGYNDAGQQSDTDYISGAPYWCKNGLSTKLPLRYPVDMTNLNRPLTSDFGFRNIKKGSNFHPALDIGVPDGTLVYATADGVVTRADWDNKGGGNVIDIKHDNGLITQYMHLSRYLVSKGQKVRACEQIALSGNTGISTGPHLDYRVRFESNKNKYVDILCPRKAGNRDTKTSVDANMSMIDDEHSLFHAPYKFRSQSDKSAQWRIAHGHCMSNTYDLLPDEQ